ncbi:MAG: response regulator [Planctomycetota bacterium]|nr:response regulator [Planctomycetota bacterium]
MLSSEDFENKRILLVDDNPAIHSDFRKILLNDDREDSLREAEAMFFGESTEEPQRPGFELDFAHQGVDGYEKAKTAVALGRPYAVAFVDMRMPPGWDGLETIEKLWEVDPDLQVVICSAYSDHSWVDICGRLGQTDQLLILKKPFDNVEVSQLALALTQKWSLARRARLNTEQLNTQVEKQTRLLREKDRELRHKQKLEAIGSLAGGVAHEFNNLLQVIHGLTTIALEDTPEEDPTFENLMGVVEAANRATGITQHLLSFSRRQPAQKMVFSTNEIVTATLQMVRPLLGKQIDIRTELAVDAGEVMANGDLISQAVLNLCVNARDAMPEGGHLSLVTESLEVQDAEARYPVPIDLRSGPYTVISVTDTGSGIPEDQLDRIFEPFYTTKDVGKGTGMGLSMVFGTVEEHGGGVTVQSRVGQGTTFRIFLPRAREVRKDPSGSSQGVEQQEERFPGGKETLLVVDDEPQIRQIMVRMLGKAGYRVLEAENGLAAVELYRDRHLEIDGVLLDMMMPVMNGREALREMKAIDDQLVAIGCSGHDPGEQPCEAESEETDAFFTTLHKPVTRSGLLQAVRKTMDQGLKAKFGNSFT